MAAREGQVHRFGDPSAPRDSAAVFGTSRLLPALRSAAAGARPIVVVTDGEIQDASDLPPICCTAPASGYCHGRPDRISP